MFLATENPKYREEKIRRWLHSEPSVALVVAAVHFEWTVCRAIIFLSHRPNRDIRRDLERVYGLEKYKDFWKTEIAEHHGGATLPSLVTDWRKVTEAFKARDRLVHGRDRFTRKMATPYVEDLLRAAADVRDYCSQMGVNFQSRLPVRKKMREHASVSLVGSDTGVS